MVVGTGVVAGDFSQILSDLGTSVTWKDCTKTTDPMTGEESSSFASAVSKTVIFFKEDQKYMWDKEGLIALADAYVLFTSGTFARYDQITYDSETYYIEEVIKRYVANVGMCDYCRLFKVA